MALKDRLSRMPVIGTALKVQDRYKADAGDQFAGAIGFFGFLSLFPLILLALSVTGYVLVGDAEAQTRVAEGIQEAIPGLSAALSGGEGDTGVGEALDTIIANKEAGGVVGLVLLLLSGLRVVNSAQTATLVVFRVDRSQMKGIAQKAKQVGALVTLGVLALAGVAAGAAIGAVTSIDLFGVMNVLAPILTVAGTFVLDAGLFLAAYRVFGTRAGPPVRRLVPGALLGGAGWTVLKLVGSTYVSSQVSKAGALYGALGGVIGLMLLLYLAGRLFVYGAELSAVRAPDPEHPAASGEDDSLESRLADDDPAGAAAASGAAPMASQAGEPGPPPLPRTAHDPAMLAPTASEQTRARLAAMPEPERSGHGRHALAFALAVGAVAGLAGALRPWDDE